MTDGPERPRPEDIEEEDLYVVGQRLPEPQEVRDRVVAAAAVLTAVGGLAFGVGMLVGAPRTVYGGGLALALLALAYGFHRYFRGEYPEIVAIEPRPGVGAEDEEEPYGDVPKAPRRSFLGWLLAGAAGVLGLSFAAPVASLGPAPGDALRRTLWREGARVVTGGGRPVRPEDIEPGSIVTAWPEDAIGHERSAVIVIRLQARGPEPPTNPDWVIDEMVVAYSKICTHAGCPVGLFREVDDSLFCPCHQATFDVARAAEPVFGPAPRPLPQLPLGLDDDGALVALGDFHEPVGPGYGWLQRAREDIPLDGEAGERS